MAEIGVIASIIGLISTGAKLSLAIFDFASSIGHAGKELRDVGTEISLFCSVVTQLQAVLTHAHFRYSTAAINTTKQIIDRCQQILDDFGDIVNSLQSTQGPGLVPTVDFVARVRWTFKKSQVQVLRSTLDSCKLTLHVMLTTMEVAQKVSRRRRVTAQNQHCSGLTRSMDRVSTRLTQEEDERHIRMTQGLILSQQCSISNLEVLEEETEKEESKTNRVIATKDASQLKKVDKNLDRLSGLLGTLSVNTSTVELPVHFPRRPQRASIWLNSILADDSISEDPHPGTRLRRLSSAQTTEKPLELLRKWTDQADHVQEQRTSTGAIGSNDLWNHGHFSFSAPDLNAIDEVVEENEPKPGVGRVLTDLLSPGSTARSSSITWPVTVAVGAQNSQGDTDLTYTEVVGALMDEYALDLSATKFELFITYGGHTRKLEPLEKPLAVAKQFSDMALDPTLLIRKT